jgi:chitinase
MRGKFLAIETKAHDNSKITALQLKQLQDIEAAGGETFVIHSANVHLFEIWFKENK